MNHILKNKIEAKDKSIKELLKDQKFYIDYFQREYRWQEKHIKVLIEDLTTAFLRSYKTTDKRTEVENYQKAVSSHKCNKRFRFGIFLNQLREYLPRGLKPQAFARPMVHLIDRGAYVLFVKLVERHALGKVLA